MLNVSIITPQKTTLQREADEVIIPTITGEITVLPHHLPVVTQLSHGELIIKKGNTSDHIAIEGGFLEVSEDKVSILADYAVQGKDISSKQAQEAKTKAEEAMKEKGLKEEELEALQTELRRAVLELKVARKIKRTV